MPMSRAPFVQSHTHPAGRQPEIAPVRKSETRRHHADDCIIPTSVGIDRKSLADDVRIGRETTPPQFMTDHRHPMAVPLVILRKKCATEQRLHAQNAEKTRRCVNRFHLFDTVGADQIEIVGAQPSGPESHAFKDAVLFPPIQEIRPGHLFPVEAAARTSFPQHDEAVRLRIRQRLEKDSVDHAEDRCIRPNAQRQCEHGHAAEAWALQQQAQGIAKVIHFTVYELRITDPVSRFNGSTV